MFGRPKLKVIKSRIKVQSLGVRLPPPAPFVGALHTVLGSHLGVPIKYSPTPGVEVRVSVDVLNDPRVIRTMSYLFIGDSTIFKERSGTYEVIMPPSSSSTDSITKALGRVLSNAVRWERLLFFIAQFPSCGSLFSLFSKDNLKGLRRPWGKPNPVGIPPPDSLVGLGEDVKYGDVVTVHDGVVEAGLSSEVPEYELGYVIYDEDIVTAVYVVNPSRVTLAYSRATEVEVKKIKEFLKVGAELSEEGGRGRSKGKGWLSRLRRR